MSESIGHIHYRTGFEMGKPNRQCSSWEEGKSSMNAYFLKEGQVLNLENYHVGVAKDRKDVEFEGIEVTI